MNSTLADMSDYSKRLTVLIVSAAVMATAGSFADFSLFSEPFQSRFNLTFSDINMISAVMNSSLYVTYLATGPMYDRYGVRITQAVSAVTFTLGYLLIYLSYLGMPTSAGLLAFYYFIGGFGSNSAYLVKRDLILFHRPW
jgi:MFS family permease